ncbi:hypothetical protein HDE_04170 [Halotydeus destructor]|nr:hypothetical protein HDE_04170 [Halotydeus destructor]
MKTIVTLVAIFAIAAALSENAMNLVKSLKGSSVTYEQQIHLPDNAVYIHADRNSAYVESGNNVTIVMGNGVVVLTESGSKIILGVKGLVNAAFNSVLRVTIGGIINTDDGADIAGLDQVSVHTGDHSKVRLRNNAVVTGGAFSDVVVGRNSYVLVGPNSTVVKGDGSVMAVCGTAKTNVIREKLFKDTSGWRDAVKAFFD